MLWDPKTGAILTRTPGSWAKIILFYCIYYSLLAGFWIGCLQMFFLTLPENEPRYGSAFFLHFEAIFYFFHYSFLLFLLESKIVTYITCLDRA